jgi:hypothetical protein
MITVCAGSLSIDQIVLNSKEAAYRLGVPVQSAEQWIEEYAPLVAQEIQPKYCYTKSLVRILPTGKLDLGYTRLESKDLQKNLCGCTMAYTFAVTLGLQIDRTIAKLAITSPGKAFAVDALASAYAESAADTLSQMFQAEIPEGFVLAPRFSPGYGDLSLNVQPSVLEALEAAKYTGITLGANLLMTPRKSITAIQGVKQQ